MIRIHGLRYSIRLVEVPITSDLDGETLFSDCIISVRASMPTERQQQTMWHEALHIILEGESGGGLSKKEERFVTRVSNSLYSMLVDNKLLVPGWWDNVVDEHVELTTSKNRVRGINEHMDPSARESLQG